MLLAAAPILLGLMLLVALDGGRPIFAHTRIGKKGRPFKCLKIRSMHPDAEAQPRRSSPPIRPPRRNGRRRQACQRPPGDPDRRLPAQVEPRRAAPALNVLRGDMSLRRPPPGDRGRAKRYGPAVESYMALKPGSTGPGRSMAATTSPTTTGSRWTWAMPATTAFAAISASSCAQGSPC